MRKMIPTELRALLTAAKRLIASEQGTRARKTSSRRFRSAVNALLKMYPVVAGKSGAVCVCPVCRIPLRTWSVARHHFVVHAQWGGLQKDHCPCCRKQFGLTKWREDHPFDPVNSKGKLHRESNPDSSRGVELHLAALKRRGKLEAHVIMAMTKAVFAEKGDGVSTVKMSYNTMLNAVVGQVTPGERIRKGDLVYADANGFVTKHSGRTKLGIAMEDSTS